MPDVTDDFWILGRFSGVFGIKGWLKVHSHTDPREAILDYSNWYVSADDEWQAVTVAEGQKHGKQVIVRMDGVQDRDAADVWVGREIGVRRAEMPDAEEGHYYWTELLGLKVVNTKGRILGVVDHLLATGANDVLVVRGDTEVLIPFVEGHFIRQVDFAAGVIQVDWDWTDED